QAHRKLQDSAYGEHRRLEVRRPGSGAYPVDPHRLHTGGARTDDVELGIVADVQYLVHGKTGAFDRLLEDERVRLECTYFAGGRRALEPVLETDLREIGIAVARGEQAEPTPQPFEPGKDVVVQLHFVARANEYVECLLDHAFGIAE